jgi:choline dehydrogenase
LKDFNRWDNNGKSGRADPIVASRNNQRWGLYERIKQVQRDFPEYLTIETGALAKRILFEGTTAVGIEFLRGRALYEAHRDYNPDQDATTIEVYADREVIISAGSFNSPQLLKLSGIGPKDELEQHGIPVVVDLPGVGANMQDRYEVGLNFRMKQPWNAYTQCNFQADSSDICYNLWKQDGSSIYGSNTILYWSAKQSSVSPAPDLCLFTGLGYFLGYSPEVISQAEAEGSQSQVFLVLKAFTENNAGTVKLQSANPREMPLIEFHYFDEGSDKAEKDLQAVLEGVKELRRLTSMSDYQDLIDGEVGSFADAVTDEQIRQKIRDEAWGHHACCTNKIGTRSDDMAVVDKNFKVYGTKNLRVVDASVFPRIPGYFVLSAIYLISEKAADVILEDALEQPDVSCDETLRSPASVLLVPIPYVMLLIIMQALCLCF